MKPKQIMAVTKYNFRQWHKNPRIAITFCLAFVLCFLLSDKAVKFAKEYRVMFRDYPDVVSVEQMSEMLGICE